MQIIEARTGKPIRQAIDDLYHGEGMTLKEIAAEWGVGFSTVSEWMRDLGIETRIFGTKRPREERRRPTNAA
jgi:transposase